MKFLNYKMLPLNILHANGWFYADVQLLELSRLKLYIPNNITVIILENNELESVAIKHLKMMNIPYINGFYTDGEHKDFKIIYKLDYTLHALKQVKTDYVIYIDSRDAVIDNFDGIVEKFLSYGKDILYCAECGDGFPDAIKVKREEVLKEKYPSSCRLNAGCFIAKTKEAIKIYKRMVKIRKSIGMTSYPTRHSCLGFIDGGDLALIRFYADFFPTIGIDYECKIFRCLMFINRVYLDKDTIIIDDKRYPFYDKYYNSRLLLN